MPMVVPVSEMQRHGAELVNHAMQTKEPIYLTRRGYKSVVLVDAEEYDRLASEERARIREVLDAKAHIDRGHEEVLRGDVVSLEDALAQLHRNMEE